MMASVWCLMLVVLMAAEVFARDCTKLENVKNCDHCIQCGGVWCRDKNELQRCSQPNDEFCPMAREEAQLPNLGTDDSDAVELWDSTTGKPVHIQQATKTNVPVTKEVIMVGKGLKIAEPTYMNSSLHNFKLNSFYMKIKNKELENSIYTIVGHPFTDFCPAIGSKAVQTVSYRLDAGQGKFGRITYHVPCACGCTSTGELNSDKCNGKGNYTCGICVCEHGWKGESCEEKDYQTIAPECEDRGDITQACRYGGGADDEPLCSGNGICTCEGNQGKCECRTDIPEYHGLYFDKEYCMDICGQISYCDSCITNPRLSDDGRCHDCPILNLYVTPLNTTFLDDKDEKGRKIWIDCVEKTQGCDIKYVAMKKGGGKGDTHVMIVDSCKGTALDLSGAGVNLMVPSILGVVALVAAATAVAGYMVWKNRGPPLPFANQDYGNIEAEDCTGENPLYKPPTSSFKNPTYGKW